MRVMATVNLPGLSAGQETHVDPRVPYIEKCLRGRYLIPISEEGYPLPAPPGALGVPAETEPAD